MQRAFIRDRADKKFIIRRIIQTVRTGHTRQMRRASVRPRNVRWLYAAMRHSGAARQDR